MGKRALALEAALRGELGPSVASPRPGLDSICAAGLMDEVHEIYHQLGGVQDEPRVRPGPWDFRFDGWTLELDEENHFNRYRLLTLEAASYRDDILPGLTSYRRYCENFEGKCSTHGKYWTSSSTEKEFGLPGERGELAGLGSPRWRQRAFYDYIKDLAPITDGTPVSRISIWDEVSVGDETQKVGLLLRRSAEGQVLSSQLVQALIELIDSRRSLAKPAVRMECNLRTEGDG